MASSSPPANSASRSGTVYGVALAVLVPHAVLAKYFLGLSLVDIPEPIRSLLLLLVVSSAIHFILRPTVLDLFVPRSDTSTARVRAEWTWANFHWPSFLLSWLLTLAQKWGAPMGDGATFLVGFSTFAGLVFWGCLNAYHNDVELAHPASPRGIAQAAAHAKARTEAKAAAAAKKEAATIKA